MKLFQEYERSVAFFLFSRDNLDFEGFRTRFKIIFSFVTIGGGVSLTGLFMILEAESFQEYSEAFYPFITMLVNLEGLFYSFAIRRKIYNTIDSIEMIIDSRKFSIFSKGKVFIVDSKCHKLLCSKTID